MSRDNSKRNKMSTKIKRRSCPSCLGGGVRKRAFARIHLRVYACARKQRQEGEKAKFRSGKEQQRHSVSDGGGRGQTQDSLATPLAIVCHLVIHLCLRPLPLELKHRILLILVSFHLPADFSGNAHLGDPLVCSGVFL